MTRRQLARELRGRHLEDEDIPPRVLRILTDDQIIESYAICEHCGDLLVSDTYLNAAIRNAEDCEAFLEVSEDFPKH